MKTGYLQVRLACVGLFVILLGLCPGLLHASSVTDLSSAECAPFLNVAGVVGINTLDRSPFFEYRRCGDYLTTTFQGVTWDMVDREDNWNGDTLQISPFTVTFNSPVTWEKSGGLFDLYFQFLATYYTSGGTVFDELCLSYYGCQEAENGLLTMTFPGTYISSGQDLFSMSPVTFTLSTDPVAGLGYSRNPASVAGSVGVVGFAPVPEPGSLMLLCSGLLGVGGVVR